MTTRTNLYRIQAGSSTRYVWAQTEAQARRHVLQDLAVSRLDPFEALRAGINADQTEEAKPYTGKPRGRKPKASLEQATDASVTPLGVRSAA